MTSNQPPPPLGRLARAGDIDDVLHNLDQVLDWAIHNESRIGYFAVVYKRVTLAIRKAIDNGEFADGKRIVQLDVVFAQRYFDSLNAYFRPTECYGMTLPWEVALVGTQDPESIILQHILTAFNAHISFDLGMACFEVAADSLKSLKPDFDHVNEVLDLQAPGMVDAMQKLSPELVWTRRLIPNELQVLDGMLKNIRDGAWEFASYMALNRDKADQKRVEHAAWTATLGSWYLRPPTRLTPYPALVRAIARHESDNVAHNIKALEGT